MKRGLMILALLWLGTFARADVFNLGPGLANLDMVTVRDAGNAGDTRKMNDGTSGYGAVSYTYNIGKYEVTAAQYCDFLNHKAKSDPAAWGLYSSSMAGEYGCGIQQSGSFGEYCYSVAPGYANRPVNYVSFADACRFANWLNNGQGDGDTENGAYSLPAPGGILNHVRRNAGWKWAVTSEDEWYKAAYFKGDLTNSGYWLYPTQSDTDPVNTLVNPDPGNHANYYRYVTGGYTVGSPYWTTEVGEFENSASAYGTFDQAGNVSEWNESIIPHGTGDGPYRCTRGGSLQYHASWMVAGYRDTMTPGTLEGWSIGFRVVQYVPEPSNSVALLAGLCLLPVVRRKRVR